MVDKYYRSARQELLPLVPSSVSRALDVGCGAGEFGQLLRQSRGIEVHGVEPDREAAALAKENLDYVYEHCWDGALEPIAAYDIVFFNDSIEHMENPSDALSLSRKFLSTHGFVFCSIPNFRFFANLEHLLLEKDFRYEKDGIRDQTHLRFFTRKSILRMFESCGFDVQQCIGINIHKRRKIALLKLLFPTLFDDVSCLQYVVVAVPNAQGSPNA